MTDSSVFRYPCLPSWPARPQLPPRSAATTGLPRLAAWRSSGPSLLLSSSSTSTSTTATDTSARVRLHRLRRSPRLGICRPTPAHPIPDSPLPSRARRFPPQHSLHPRAGVVSSSSPNRPARPRIRRTPLRPSPQRHRHPHRSAISLQRKPARHQLPRTESLDGLRLLRHPRDKTQQASLLALVRRHRRYRHGGEILHRPLRLRHSRRTSTHRATPRLPQSLDLAGRPRRLSDFPSQPALEYSLSLALPRIDAQHPRRRPQRHPSRSLSISFSRPSWSIPSPLPSGLRDCLHSSSLRGSSPTVRSAGAISFASPSSSSFTERIIISLRSIPCCWRRAQS